MNLILAARRPIKWAAYEHSYPVPKPPGSPAATCPRPPAAGGRLDLPDTAPLRNQLEATHGCDWLPRRWVGRSPFARLWSALRCIFRQRARIVDAHIAIKNAVGPSDARSSASNLDHTSGGDLALSAFSSIRERLTHHGAAAARTSRECPRSENNPALPGALPGEPRVWQHGAALRPTRSKHLKVIAAPMAV